VIVIGRAGGPAAAETAATPAAAPAATLAADRCRALGARVFDLVGDPADEDACAAGVAGIMNWHGSIDVLVNDCAGGFEAALAAGQDGTLALRAALDAAWVTTRAVANAAFIPDAHGGRVINVAPRPAEGAHPGREAARAALENMARTLSIEWARFGVRTTAILPGTRTDPADVAGLVAFLASQAGDYYSGCAFNMR
jgi:NAD(P)-dependent dehydrogenase (short-subunit alcohol dehydrogenase family)